jgi:hypothetical protein
LDLENAAADRAAVRAAYSELFERISQILFRHDPIGINFDTNRDEYDAEAGTIIPRLRGATTRDAVQYVVHQEFVRWFSLEEAGPPIRYAEIATDIWQLRDLFPKPLPSVG